MPRIASSKSVHSLYWQQNFANKCSLHSNRHCENKTSNMWQKPGKPKSCEDLLSSNSYGGYGYGYSDRTITMSKGKGLERQQYGGSMRVPPPNSSTTSTQTSDEDYGCCNLPLKSNKHKPRSAENLLDINKYSAACNCNCLGSEFMYKRRGKEQRFVTKQKSSEVLIQSTYPDQGSDCISDSSDESVAYTKAIQSSSSPASGEITHL